MTLPLNPDFLINTTCFIQALWFVSWIYMCYNFKAFTSLFHSVTLSADDINYWFKATIHKHGREQAITFCISITLCRCVRSEMDISNFPQGEDLLTARFVPLGVRLSLIVRLG